MMNSKTIAGIVSGAIALAGLVGFVVHKVDNNKKAIDEAVAKLADKTSVDIEREILEKAAEKAADKAAEKAMKDVESEIEKKVKAAVDKAYQEKIKELGATFETEFKSKFDFDKFRDDIELKASKALVDSFKTKLKSYENSLFTAIPTSTSLRINI